MNMILLTVIKTTEISNIGLIRVKKTKDCDR